MTCAFAAVLYGFTGTTDLLVEIRRDRSAMFRQVDQYTVCNVYQIKVEGFTAEQRIIDVSISGAGRYQLFGLRQAGLAEDNATWLPYRVCSRNSGLPRTELTFNFKGGALSAERKITFLAGTL